MSAPVDIREVMTDPALLGGQFSGDSWAAWRALLSGFYGLKLSDDEAERWHALTGRTEPHSAHDEAWLVMGRRAGKSQASALIAIYESCFIDRRDQLSPGEVATVMCLASDRRQARVVFRYVPGLLQSNVMLERMVTNETAESIELSNGSVIEVHTASYRKLRGYSVACAICDEIAFWYSEGTSEPDTEIISALRPALASLGGRLLCISSPYARRGSLWYAYKSHYADEDSRVLVAQADTLTMNPTLPTRIIDEARQRDPASAAAEYDAEFRTDIEQFISLDTVEAVQRPAPPELPYIARHRYFAFCDPAGGSGGDSMTLAIAHIEDGHTVVDVVREHRPPFSPDAVVQEFCGVLKAYGIRRVVGDRFGGEWPSERFESHGVQYISATRSKSQLYQDLLPLLNSHRIELPPSDRLKSQLVALERRSTRSGKDQIDHPAHGHDDLANAIAGVVTEGAANRKKPARVIY